MATTLRWVGEDEIDRVAETRMRCYAHAAADLEKYREGIRADVRAKAGDFLIAERDGVPVGTSTALSMKMWVRGGVIPCQGVAFVGTVKTHRRRVAGEDGVGTQLMRETLRMGRDRGAVVSALMPFRASFYEHFGYGLVERRNEWTLPLGVLPSGDWEGVRFYQSSDLDELVQFRQRMVERGQCDIERPREAWEAAIKRTGGGFFLVDRPAVDGLVRGYLWIEHEKIGTKDYLRIVQNHYEDMDALRRQLHFLASLRDQYLAVVGAFPADLPLNWLLKETQLPHRHVNHPTAELRPQTRMQVRILDHKRFLESLRLKEQVVGKVVVSVRESEGHVSTFGMDINEGRISVSSGLGSGDFSCSDHVWAAIACGDLAANVAIQMGLARAETEQAAGLLDVLSVGGLPYCTEYF
ncbi:MAG TPA: GNAT family N-acetyltransferase [Tepidisphaeraceae bacterium]|jgi:predicted acetyltransferase